MHDYDDEYDDGTTSKYDGRWGTVACLDDRVILTITYLEMRAEERDGFFSDDDILDAAEKFTMSEKDADGDWINNADVAFLVDSVYEWVS